MWRRSDEARGTIPARGGRRGRRLATVAALAAVAVVSVGVGGASAYRLLGIDWRNQANPMGEPLQICVSGGPSGAARMIRRAAARWNYGGFRFTFRSDGCSGGGYPNFNGVNQIDFGGLGGGTLGETTSFYSTSNRGATECDIRLTNQVSWYVGQGRVPAGQFDLLTIALHELGHCLGLGHSTGPGWPVMYPSYSSGDWNRALTSDDVAGRNAIYGR